MKIDILTLFPEMVQSYFSDSIIKRAIDDGYVEINLVNFRDFSTNKHHTVDDYAYGGGAGMLISVVPIHLALESIDYKDAWVVLTSPSGKTLNQKKLVELSQKRRLVIICGHYEGIDARVLNYVDEEISIGDYVLTGGELAAGVIVDGTVRLLDGVISGDSIVDESFSNQLLEYPQYTRPPVYDGAIVPEVLISGHHANIEKWKKRESLKKTKKNRPELLENLPSDLRRFAEELPDE